MDPELDFLRDLDALRLGPDDVLVLKAERPLPQAKFAQLRDLVQEAGLASRVLVVDHGFDMKVVARDGS